jgi:hypothetical protein
MAQEPQTAKEAPDFPEAEFVASSSFRSASYVQPLWKQLHFEGDYFGGDENDVGYTGLVGSSAGRNFAWLPDSECRLAATVFKQCPHFHFGGLMRKTGS